MISRVYATTILPLVFAIASKWFLRSWGMSSGAAFLFALAVGLILWLAGDEIESYYFREIHEGRDRLHRVVRFALLLPAIYAAGLVALSLPVWLAVIPVSFAVALATGVCTVCLWFFLQDDHHRGGRLYRHNYAEKLARQQLQPGDQTVPFGGVPIALHALDQHMCFIGTTGSGKTTAIKQIMAEVMPLIGKSERSLRAVVYDPKTEFFAFLSNHATCPVHSLHPLDIRGKSWDMAKSIRTPMLENQFAVNLIPVVEGPNEYFRNAARSVLATVIGSFNLHSPGNWTFGDVIHGCESDPRIRAILSRDETTKSCIQKYLDAREASSILSELDTHLRPFRPIAACWARAESISLEDFVHGQTILILPMHRSAMDQLLRLNGLIFNCLSQLLLAEKTNEQLKRERLPERQTFVFFDEVRDIAKHLNDIKNFFTLGRAYGISNIIGYQSQEGLKDALDQNRAPELLGQCHYRGLLPVNEKETAQYLSQMCQEREVYRRSPGALSRFQRNPW